MNGPPKRRFRFRLASLLALVAFSALGFLGFSYWLQHRPIRWRAFSQQVFDQRCQNGSPMLIFFGADWDVTAKVVETRVFDDPSVRYLTNRNRIDMVYADMTHPNPQASALLRAVERPSTPLILIYFPESIDAPIVLSGLPKAESVVSTIKRRAPP